MAFNFGGATTSTPSLNFGTAAKPAFGTAAPFSFGSGAATAAPGGNFSFGSTPANTNTGFGGFGTPATTNTGAGGFGNFGAPAATSAPQAGLFGGFGAPATTSTAFTGFGTNTGTTGSAFGSNAAPAFGAQNTGFGATNTGFGATNTAFGAGNTSFGATNTFGAANTGFGATNTGFGATNTGFGATNTGFGATNTGFGAANTGFGGTNTGFGGAAAPAFGSTFGAGGSTFGGGMSTFGAGTGAFAAKPFGQTGQTGFGGFGAGLGGAFGQQQQQQQQQPQALSPNEALYNAVFNCNIYGDERDQILAKWNFLQAKWGFGKAYFCKNSPPLELTEQNPLCRFKAIGYSCLPTAPDKDGLVQIVFNKTEQELKSQQAQLQTSLTAVFGNKPNLTITIDEIKTIGEGKAHAMIFVLERTLSVGAGSRIPASQVSQFLNTPTARQQLSSMGACAATAHAAPDAGLLRQYTETPPTGIDVRLWKQAQADNPDAEKYIPVPMVGFSEVKWRMQCQEEETKLHAAFLARTSEELSALRASQTSMHSALQDQHRRYMQLHHRLLAVVVRQESVRRAGTAMTPEDEALRSRLEALQAHLAAPTHFNGRLSELLSQIRMQRCENASATSERYSMDLGAQDDIKQFLAMQQKGMSHLMETVRTNLKQIKLMQDGLASIRG